MTRCTPDKSEKCHTVTDQHCKEVQREKCRTVQERKCKKVKVRMRMKRLMIFLTRLLFRGRLATQPRSWSVRQNMLSPVKTWRMATKDSPGSAKEFLSGSVIKWGEEKFGLLLAFYFIITKVPDKTCDTVEDTECELVPKKDCHSVPGLECKTTPREVGWEIAWEKNI